ncbi:MAG: hypothetical protein A2604_01960 [Candidatus Liptonbacteria bacterium RIFOXYD1_FULL_36_11]|uniref:ABC transporter n=1 Tax=Candidatus Liptonbacteria bacterium RIFOXYD1_FULL_36_11 TaxID=1798656 RepID=A0A1G2CQ75_9BACT|nr:MAG: hypothetical protein A2604_01960 [Candidatus Liptonbacteria bacterium RIFOXYD1_FULL_36_11]
MGALKDKKIKKSREATREALKEIWEAIKPWKRKVFFGLFLFLITSAISASIPYIYGSVTDMVLRGGKMDTVVWLLGMWLVVSFLRGFFSYKASIIANDVAVLSSNKFIVDYFAYVIKLPMTFHKDKKVGSVSQKIVNAADRGLFDLVENVLFSLLPNLTLFIISLCFLFYTQKNLALVLVLSSLAYIAITLILTRPIIKKEKKNRRIWERVYGFFFDALHNIHNVKLSSNEKYEIGRLQKNFDRATEQNRKLFYLWNKLSFWQGVTFDAGFVAVFAAGVMMMSKGTLTVGQLLMFVGYTSLLTSPLAGLGKQYRTFRQAVVNVGRAMDLKKEKVEDLISGRKMEIKGDFNFEDVSFAYPKKKEFVLKGVSFSVRKGEVVALVGKSGVGKTTLMDLAGKYYLPQVGRVEIDGVDLKKINLQSLREQMAVVPQEVMLFNDTVLNNIRYAKPKASEKEVKEAAKMANAHEFIMKFSKGYRQVVGERGIKLSTGQKQRIAIARAILRNPRILILDEATSALDSESEKLIQEALKKLVEGRTTFIIAHRLSTIQNADKIIVLENGKIAEMGRHEDLMKNPDGIYRNFWELQTARERV